MEDQASGAGSALSAIEQIRSEADAAAKSIEQARLRADNDASYANNAKLACEDHAKTIAQIKGSVEADSSWFATTKANLQGIADAIAATKTNVAADEQAIAEHKAALARESAAASSAAQKVANAATAAELKQSEASTASEKATSDAASIAQSRATADAALIALQAQQAQIADVSSKVKADATLVEQASTKAKADVETIADVVTTSRQAQDRVTAYEGELTRLARDMESLKSKIEGLLPGAASAGLASAFHAQKERFAAPQKWWLRGFVATIIALIVVGFIGLPIQWPWASATAAPAETWETILRHFTVRLPIVIPLVWLAIYAARNYTMALRVEEDYAFKEAVSRAFEGYKREMANIETQPDGGRTSPLEALCANVLTTIARRPGLIYEGQHDDVTPLSGVVKPVSEMVGKILPGKGGGPTPS